MEIGDVHVGRSLRGLQRTDASFERVDLQFGSSVFAAGEQERGSDEAKESFHGAGFFGVLGLLWF